MIKRVEFKTPNNFIPSVELFSYIKSGETLGRATVEIVLERHSIKGKLLVDEGVFVMSGEELTSSGQRSTVDGVVKIEGNDLLIIEKRENSEFKLDNIEGKLVYISKDSLIIEAEFLSIPTVVSQGGVVEGDIVYVKSSAVKDIYNRIVIYSKPLTIKSYNDFVAQSPLCIISPSIDWNDYKVIFKESDYNLAIMQGFGHIGIWSCYDVVFSNLKFSYGIVDLSRGVLNVSLKDGVDLKSNKISICEPYWGREVIKTEKVSGKTLAVLKSGKRIFLNEYEVID